MPLTLLTLLFVGLKLTGYIDWSWWFVLMPAYILPLVFFVFALVFGTKVTRK